MDRTVSSLRQFRTSCPYLARTPIQTLRKMSSSSLQGGNSRLSVRAEQCPIMQDALTKQDGLQLFNVITDNKASPSAFNALATVFLKSAHGGLYSPSSLGCNSSFNNHFGSRRSMTTNSRSLINKKLVQAQPAPAPAACPFSGSAQTRSYVSPSQKNQASVHDAAIHPRMQGCPFASQAQAAADKAHGLAAVGRAPQTASPTKKKFAPQVSHLRLGHAFGYTRKNTAENSRTLEGERRKGYTRKRRRRKYHHPRLLSVS